MVVMSVYDRLGYNCLLDVMFVVVKRSGMLFVGR